MFTIKIIMFHVNFNVFGKVIKIILLSLNRNDDK